MYLRDKLPAVETAPLNEVQMALIMGRKRIEAGWCQHNWVVERSFLWRKWTQMCAVQAVGANTPAAAALDRAARSFGYQSAIRFNDAPWRKKREILGMFDLAIATSC